MKKKENAFTLIELLAIIVILAIIAVITVPIILNIIENSRKGAATDSAYGYKDAIQMYYVDELSKNSEYTIPNGSYTVNNDGYLVGNLTLNIDVAGTKPDGGTVEIEKNTLKNACLVFDGYAVTFTGGSITSTEKGDCGSSSVPTIASCPGCKFIYTTSDFAIEGSDAVTYNGTSSDMPTAQDGLTDNYTTLIGTGGHPYFLGIIESTTTSGKIGRAFVCGIENDTPFCLEGYDTSKWSDDANVGILNTIFPSCAASSSASGAECLGSSLWTAEAFDTGYVFVTTHDGYCGIDEYGNLRCIEH